MSDLEPIIKWNMNKLEAKAYKIALIWEKLVRKEFPKMGFSKLKKSGDPRKCHLYRHCHKLARETEGLIPSNEYKLYILAQLQVLRSLKNKDGVHALIDCQCLVGDRAWRRWKLWKKYYDKEHQKVSQRSAEDVGVKPKEAKMVAELNRTKKFLLKQFGKMPTAKDYGRLITDLTIVRWVTLGKMSPYYVVMSPVLKEALGGKEPDEVFAIDLGVYRSFLTPEIREFFENEIERKDDSNGNG